MSVPDQKTRTAMLAANIGSASGRARIAAAASEPLRKQRDYLSVARKIAFVNELADGALPIYDKDIDVTAYVVSEEGDNILSVSRGERIIVPTFEIASNPTISITELKARRFDLVDRALTKGRSKINEQEDARIFAVLDAVAADVANPNPVIPVTGNLTSNVLADAFANIERSRISVTTVLMNAKDASDLRKWDRDTYDPETQREVLKSGILGSLWGANIVTSSMIAEGTVYVCGEPEFLAVMPVRSELTVLSADEPSKRKVGFSIFEEIGFGCHNPYGLQKLTITR